MSRRKRALKFIDAKKQFGLEIGPLVSPIVTKKMGDIVYADHASTEELQKKYSKDPNIDESKIVDITYVLGSKTLPEAVGAETFFDYVIASHVIEHVPNLIGWLDEIFSILKPGGVLSLMIPDKRFTFDIRRRCTNIVDVVDAHIHQLKKPSPRHVYDHFSNFMEVDCHKVWAEGNTGLAKMADNNPGTGLDMALNSFVSDHYYDSHCWVFTPYSFFELLKDMASIDLFQFEVIDFNDTNNNEFEFYVSLKKPIEAQQKDKSHIINSIPVLPEPDIRCGIEYFQTSQTQKNKVSTTHSAPSEPKNSWNPFKRA